MSLQTDLVSNEDEKIATNSNTFGARYCYRYVNHMTNTPARGNAVYFFEKQYAMIMWLCRLQCNRELKA